MIYKVLSGYILIRVFLQYINGILSLTEKKTHIIRKFYKSKKDQTQTSLNT